MREFENVEKYLLKKQRRKLAKWVLIGVPFLWLIFGSLSVIILPETGPFNFKTFWEEWGLFLFHLPVSVALYMIIMAREEDEDEMYSRLRLEAMFHGVRFIFFGILAVGLFGSLTSSLWNQELTLGTVGGEMAVITLLLLYANGSYFFLKKQYHEE